MMKISIAEIADPKKILRTPRGIIASRLLALSNLRLVIGHTTRGPIIAIEEHIIEIKVV